MPPVRLRLVGVNDVYSLAQLPRLASLVTAARERDPADLFLLTVAGDFLAPSLLSNLDGGRGMVDCLNALGVTHVTIGNHEDDLPTQELVDRLSELHAEVLLTNVPAFEGRHVASHIVTVKGLGIGLVGVANGDPSLFRRPPFGGIPVLPTNEMVVSEASSLRAAGCVAVIALTHQPLTADRALADLGVVDFIHGGHEHDGHLELSHQTPIAKAPMNATAAIVLDLTLDGDAPPRLEARLEPVAAHPEDPAMRARIDGHLAAVRALETRTLLALPEGVVLSSARSRTEQTSIGTLVCSRLRDALGAEAGLFNGGGLRGEKERRGSLTYADLSDEVPFENEAVVAKLPGSVVAEAVRYSRTTLRGTGGFLQVDDGAQLDDVGQLITLAGAPLDRHRIYRVATVRELLFGRDQIEPLVAYVRAHPEAVPPATTGMDAKVALLSTFAPGARGTAAGTR